MKVTASLFLAFSLAFLVVFGVNCCYGYVFPTKFSSEVYASCEEFDVDKAIIFSIINAESHFNKNCQSSKGACGLMQVLPSTASAVASEIGLETFDLFCAEDNIKIGTYYFSMLLKKFSVVDTAVCAYNAGPTRVSAWLQSSSNSADGQSLQEIPYAETREYLKKFQKNFKYYSFHLS